MTDAGPERESAAAYWGARAEEYNEFIVRVVPRYAEMLTRVVDYLPVRAERVLELGSGTGNVSLELAARYPNAELTIVDGAPEMLEVARGRLAARFAEQAQRARFVAARFEELELEPGSLHVIVASLSLHHVADVGAVYERIAPGLVAGGRFVMLDGVRGATVVEQEVHMARWRAYWHEPGRLSAAEVRDVVEHVSRHDHYRSLAEHFGMLREAGFAYADCVWRDGLFTLVVAERS